MYKKTKKSMKMTIFYDAFLIWSYSDPSFANKLPLKSSISLKKLLTYWRSLFGEVNPGTLSHQGWTKNPVYPAPCQTHQEWGLSESSQRLRAINYFRKELHVRHSAGISISLWACHGCLWTEKHSVKYFNTCTSAIIYWKHYT